MEISDDKMIVVVLVLGIILIGLALFLFYIERKLNKAEKKLEDFRKNCSCKEHSDEGA